MDPPGYAAADATAYSYDSTRGDLVMDGRIDPLIGTTTYGHDPFNRRTTVTDPNGVISETVYDELDRVRFIDYPDDTLDTTYTWDDPAVPFSLGRLTSISRNGHSVDYGYDRFGRTIQDGELTFGYDDNGNRTGIGYPGGVTATYDHDFADRETSLSVTTASGTTPVVTSAAYLPSGPLASLTFGTGAVETRDLHPPLLPGDHRPGHRDGPHLDLHRCRRRRQHPPHRGDRRLRRRPAPCQRHRHGDRSPAVLRRHRGWPVLHRRRHRRPDPPGRDQGGPEGRLLGRLRRQAGGGHRPVPGRHGGPGVTTTRTSSTS